MNKTLALIIFFLVFQVSCAYREYSLDNDKLCGREGVVKKILLNNSNDSAIRVLHKNPLAALRRKQDFKCEFEVDSLNSNGIIMKIQHVSLAKLNDEGVCYDYIKVAYDNQRPIDEICGEYDTLYNTTFVDYPGSVRVTIVINKKNYDNFYIDIVFTSFKLCAKNFRAYKPCASDICIWEGYFNDSIVNCPKIGIDEIYVEQPPPKNTSKVAMSIFNILFGIVVLVFTALGLLQIWRCFSCSCKSSSSRNGGSQPIPSAPLPNADDEKPPSYETLYPNTSV